MVFSSVTQANFTHLNKIHNLRHKGLRFLYLNEERVLVVKVVAGLIHESASRHLGDILKWKLVQMGAQGEIYNVGVTTFNGGNSCKEADCAFKPWMSRSRATNWPTLVIECGIWESLARIPIIYLFVRSSDTNLFCLSRSHSCSCTEVNTTALTRSHDIII